MLNGKNKGFTLLELLVGLFIFTISILSISVMLMNVVKNNTLNYRINQALIIAESKMEYLKNCSIDALKQGNYQDPNNPINPDETAGGTYNLEWEIKDEPPFAKHIIVTVTDKKFDIDKSISLETLLFFD